MALPLIAAGIAARLVAKKLASRAAGGITGAGAKSVNPVYKNVGSSVKVVPSKTAPKTGLEGRGNKLTAAEQKNRAGEMRWDRQERNAERRFDTYAGGPRAGESSSGNPGKKNLRKIASLDKAADKKIPIKINSNPMRSR